MDKHTELETVLVDVAVGPTRINVPLHATHKLRTDSLAYQKVMQDWLPYSFIIIRSCYNRHVGGGGGGCTHP